MSDPPYPPQEPFRIRDHGFSADHLDHQMFEISDYLIGDDGSEEDSTSAMIDFSQNPVSLMDIINNSGPMNQATTPSSSMNNESSEGERIRAEIGFRIAFRTKSELEILDDGFKWRKYGKKQVKNSPNPRNYFRCSNGQCPVKKRVERDSADSSYVITTYEGVHNHESPTVIYCSPHHNFGSGSSSQMSLVGPHS
ncbi:probable WRKY transcription factor 50 isoform X2 [Magnolia sinica]|uniref:probable WRKY transcription factor 50 isoform X2 n=1 Tax=Magnolia sinica TaxID=86752 RepID=UPI002659C8F8|nr:probable WRKY transcription factor 50 isoform X2 [Magnolia sinica]